MKTQHTPPKNAQAQALGRLGKGIPKRITDTDRKAKSERMRTMQAELNSRRSAALEACERFLDAWDADSGFAESLTENSIYWDVLKLACKATGRSDK